MQRKNLYPRLTRKKPNYLDRPNNRFRYINSPGGMIGGMIGGGETDSLTDSPTDSPTYRTTISSDSTEHNLDLDQFDEIMEGGRVKRKSGKSTVKKSEISSTPYFNFKRLMKQLYGKKATTEFIRYRWNIYKKLNKSNSKNLDIKKRLKLPNLPRKKKYRRSDWSKCLKKAFSKFPPDRFPDRVDRFKRAVALAKTIYNK